MILAVTYSRVFWVLHIFVYFSYSPLPVKRFSADISYYSQHACLDRCVQICSKFSLCDVSTLSLRNILPHNRAIQFCQIFKELSCFNQTNAQFSGLGEAELYRPEKERHIY